MMTFKNKVQKMDKGILRIVRMWGHRIPDYCKICIMVSGNIRCINPSYHIINCTNRAMNEEMEYFK